MKTRYAKGLMFAGFLVACISAFKCGVSHGRLEYLKEIQTRQENHLTLKEMYKSDPSFDLTLYNPYYLNKQINREYSNEASYGLFAFASAGLGVCGAKALYDSRKLRNLYAEN